MMPSPPLLRASSSKRSTVRIWRRVSLASNAITDSDDAVHVAGDGRIVADDDGRQSHLFVQRAQGGVDVQSCGCVDLAGRLVGQQQRWAVGQGDGDGHALLFTAG